MWKPKRMERYWIVEGSGRPWQIQWFNSAFDRARFNFGNVFRTRKLALLAAKQVRATLAKYQKG